MALHEERRPEQAVIRRSDNIQSPTKKKKDTPKKTWLKTIRDHFNY